MDRIGFDLERIKEEFYCIGGPEVLIEETADEGKAQLTLHFQDYACSEFIRLLQETNTSWAAYLSNTSCADGIIIESDTVDRTRCKLYIVELKRTITDQKWTNKVKKQFRGATLRALSFVSSLGITQISKVEYFTGYVHSSMDEHIAAIRAKQRIASTSLIAKKVFVGPKDAETLEWEQGEISLFQGKFPHHKILLTLNSEDIGVGLIHINNEHV